MTRAGYLMWLAAATLGSGAGVALGLVMEHALR
jgi:hypothetical protein